MVRGKPFKSDIKRLIGAGIMPKPIWADIVDATRPPFQPVSTTKTDNIVYPEDRLRHRYLQQNPHARRIPINLKARSIEDRHISDRFAAIQMRLMKQDKMSEQEAYHAAQDIINLRTIDLHELSEDDLYGPLSDQPIENDAVRLYMASVNDSSRDKKLRRVFLQQSKNPSSHRKTSATDQSS